MDKYVIHSLELFVRGELKTLQLSNIVIAFLSPNVTSVVQPLD